MNEEEKHFIKERFFSSHLNNIIALYPRYFQLYHKKQRKEEFSIQDYLDLQVWFNLAWFGPSSKKNIGELKNLIAKARHFTEEDKQVVLKQQLELMKEILPAYKRFQDSKQIEITTTPYYHPITPLLFNTNIAKEANKAAHLPDLGFA